MSEPLSAEMRRDRNVYANRVEALESELLSRIAQLEAQLAAKDKALREIASFQGMALGAEAAYDGLYRNGYRCGSQAAFTKLAAYADAALAPGAAPDAGASAGKLQGGAMKLHWGWAISFWLVGAFCLFAAGFLVIDTVSVWGSEPIHRRLMGVVVFPAVLVLMAFVAAARGYYALVEKP